MNSMPSRSWSCSTLEQGVTACAQMAGLQLKSSDASEAWVIGRRWVNHLLVHGKFGRYIYFSIPKNIYICKYKFMHLQANPKIYFDTYEAFISQHIYIYKTSMEIFNWLVYHASRVIGINNYLWGWVAQSKPHYISTKICR